MSIVNGLNNSINLVICDGAQDAIDKGYDYNTWEPKPKPLNIDKTVLVHGGMQSGAPSYDLVLVDEQGNKYLTVITGNLLGMLARAGRV